MAAQADHGERLSADQLRLERDRFLAFAFAGGDLLLEVDGEGLIGYAAGAARHLTGQDGSALLGQFLADLVVPEERAALRQRVIELQRRGQIGPQRWSRHQDGLTFWLAGYRLADAPETLRLSLRLAPSDGAPADLPGPEAFEQHLLRRLEAGHPEEQLTLLDLSALAELGDRLGPDRLDALRADIGSSLKELAVDPQGAGWVADDTLGVVHGGALDPNEIEHSMRLLTNDADPTGEGVALARSTLELDTADLSAADAGQALLYAINRFAETKGADFDIRSLQDGLDSMVADTVVRMVEYRGTVKAESFDLAFQPIVDLRSHRVHHYEVLARLQDGRSPYEMVTFAEQLGVVAEFDLTVCRRALELLATHDASIAVAINLSGRSLDSELFSRALLALLDQHASVRGRLLFELTESAAIMQPAHVAKMVTELRRRGLAACLDDFGSGAAAFHYLRAFRFDYVKIDGEYVKSTDHRDQAILRGMVGLCRELGVKTVAEMVETPLQAERLARLRVDLGQGYFFGRPGALPNLKVNHDLAAGGHGSTTLGGS